MFSLSLRRTRRFVSSFLKLVALLISSAFLVWLVRTNHIDLAVVNYEALVIPDLGLYGRGAHLYMTPKDEEDYKRQQKRYLYNGWLSERLPLSRQLNDSRDGRCRNNAHSNSLPGVSIIIGYQKEHPNTLLRALHSIYERTEAQLLHQVILINDDPKSDEQLETYIRAKFTKVNLLQQESESGIVAARLRAARLATADILIFLDAHVEVNVGWLPPLLAPIALDNHTITQPIVDLIQHDSFAYEPVELQNLGFNWHLQDVRLNLSDSKRKSLPAPFETPVLAGPAVAIHRSWFWRLGGYDAALSGAEGASLELSLKSWLCGGRVLLVPCSRLGHIKKQDAGYVQNRNRSAIVRRNYKRIVEVWFDEFKSQVYDRVFVLKYAQPGDLRQQYRLRRSLKCKPFSWFWQNVVHKFQYQWLPLTLGNFGEGRIQSLAQPTLCLDSRNKDTLLTTCAPLSSQKWVFTHSCHLQQGNLCLGMRNAHLVADNCSSDFESANWSYDTLQRGFVLNGLACLQVDPIVKDVFFEYCNAAETSQHWFFSGITNNIMDESIKICAPTV